ncbi:MAG TPA: MFS transporter [Streptosporangiaceae bacterium]|nr:MFS transporter [Streptosporangiaceae bacterium]
MKTTQADAAPGESAAAAVAEPPERSERSERSEPAVAKLIPLRRNIPFQTLWIGSTAATLGVAVADVAYPLAILALTGSPADAGLFAAVQTSGMIVAGLPAGHLADRRSPRWLLVLAETGRVVISALVTLALVQGRLTLGLLLVAAALLGAGQATTGAARKLLVRTVVPREQLTRALTQDEVRISGGDLVGPPIGGTLYGLRVLAHAAPFLCTVLSFVLSLISGLLVRAEPDRGGQSGAGSGAGAHGGKSGMFAGIKAIWHDPMLRATTTLLAIVNCICSGLTLIAVVILRDQSVSPAMIGVTLGGAAIGGLAGAPLVRPLHRLRPGALLVAVCGLLVPLVALLAVPYGPWWMAGLLFIAFLGIPSIRVLVDVLILRQAPAAERGRVVGAVMTLITVGMPAGLAASGLLLQYLSAQFSVLILAGLLAVGVVACASRRRLWAARWPE